MDHGFCSWFLKTNQMLINDTTVKVTLFSNVAVVYEPEVFGSVPGPSEQE